MSPPKNIIDLVLSQFQRTITYKTIDRLWTKFQETGRVVDRQRPGRPRVFSKREERNIVRDFLAHPGLSIKQATRERKKDNKAGSRRTFRRVLRSRGLVPKVSEQGKEILNRNKKARVRFAKSHANWNERDWGRIVFTDEVTLYPERTQTNVRWTRAGESSSPPEENNLRRISINIWGYIRYDGARGIVRFPETMKKEKYREMLEGHLLNAIKGPDDGEQQLLFMQDGASYHTSKHVTDWLEENNIDYLDWPAQSPDLNPIENVWAAVRNELFNRRVR